MLKNLKLKSAGVVAGLALALGGTVAVAPPAQAVTGPVVCLSIKSDTYAYLEAWFINWRYTRYINRGECSYNEMPTGTLWAWSPATRYICTSQYGKQYWWDTIYRANSGTLVLTCRYSTSW